MAPAIMEEPKLLEGVLNNAQIPHSSYLLLGDSSSVSGVPILREMISRSLERNASILLITALHPPSVFLPSYGPQISTVDLTDCIHGYSSSDDWTSVREKVTHALKTLPSGAVEIFFDAPDILAEDYSPPAVLALIRTLLSEIKARKAPSRLSILLPHHSTLFPSLMSPSLSPSLTLMHLHPLPLLSTLSTSYLTPISSAPSYWTLLETSLSRNQAEDMAFRGEVFSVEDWSATTISSSSGSGPSKSALGGVMGVSVLCRKPTGGAKAISRSLEAVSTITQAGGVGGSSRRLQAAVVDDFIPRNPIASVPLGKAPVMAGGADSQAKPTTTHQDLGLSFNLNLTDEQRRKRGEVPLPYAHEGEGVELGWEDEEDDEDDEEI